MSKKIQTSAIRVRESREEDFNSIQVLTGPSAYEIAVKNGYRGSEKQWYHESMIDTLNVVSGVNGWMEENLDVISRMMTQFVFENPNLTLSEVQEMNDLVIRLTKEIQVERLRISSLISSFGGDPNSELYDVRTGIDGEVYQTAGDAVRSQCTKLDEKIEEYHVPLKVCNGMICVEVEEHEDGD